MPFTGIPTAALDFYEDLEADNTKTFWNDHKATYDEQVRAPVAALVDALESEFGPAKVFRPYRDVRFAKDKTPYKTHQGAWFGDSHRYFHVSAAGLFVAGGYWQTSAPQVARLRRAVADDIAGPLLVAALASPASRRFEVGGEVLTRVPAGYPNDHPRADLLRHRTLTLSRELGCPAWLSTPRAVAEVRRSWRSMEPVVAWLEQHVGAD